MVNKSLKLANHQEFTFFDTKKWYMITSTMSIRCLIYQVLLVNKKKQVCYCFSKIISIQSLLSYSQLCVTASQQSLNRRRRYAIVGPQRTEKSASASFRVVPKDDPNVATGKELSFFRLPKTSLFFTLNNINDFFINLS